MDKYLEIKLNAAARSQTQHQAEKEIVKEEIEVIGAKVRLGIQHRGKITTKEATRTLRQFWEKNIIRDVEVKRRKEFHLAPGYTALWIIITFAPNYTFENYLDWPEFEENWPETFDKGLFKEDDDDN